MTALFTADWHLGHKNIIRYCGRPFEDVAQMDSVLISKTLRMLGRKGVLYFLGDLSLDHRIATSTLMRFTSQVFFIFGNHDKKGARRFVNENRGLSGHDLLSICENHVNITMCHYAMRTWPGSHFNSIEKKKIRSIQLFGHSHGTLKDISPFQLDVGIDNAAKLLGEYRPFTLDEVLEIIQHQVDFACK